MGVVQMGLALLPSAMGTRLCSKWGPQKEKILYEMKQSYNLLHIYSVIHTIQLYILFSYTHYFTRYTQVFLGMFYIANIHGAGECELDIEYFVVFVRTSGLPE